MPITICKAEGGPGKDELEAPLHGFLLDMLDCKEPLRIEEFSMIVGPYDIRFNAYPVDVEYQILCNDEYTSRTVYVSPPSGRFVTAFVRSAKNGYYAFIHDCFTLDLTEDENRNKWHRAITDENGDVIAFWVYRVQDTLTKDSSPSFYIEPMTLSSERDCNYGMLTMWDHGKQRYYLFNNMNKTCFETIYFFRFIEELDSLPEDIAISRFTKCQTGFGKLPHEMENRINSILSEGRRQSKTPIVACTCEGGWIILPYYR